MPMPIFVCLDYSHTARSRELKRMGDEEQTTSASLGLYLTVERRVTGCYQGVSVWVDGRCFPAYKNQYKTFQGIYRILVSVKFN